MTLPAQITIDALQSALKVARQEYSDCQATLKDERYCHGETIASLKRTASEQIQTAHKRAEQAEDERDINSNLLKGVSKQYEEEVERRVALEVRNKRLVELLNNPSEGMCAAARQWQITEYTSDPLGDVHKFYRGLFKAMSAELLREVDK